MKRIYLLALCALVGCDGPVATLDRSYVRYYVDGSTFKEFQLSDGTRCVAYISIGVTCEWQRPVVIVPRPE